MNPARTTAIGRPPAPVQAPASAAAGDDDQHPHDPARWEARLDLHLAPRAGRTVLAHKRQFGPLTVQRGFHPEGAPVHLYLLHPPGGVVGGDRLRIAVQVAAGAHGLLTTPGAAKFYRSAGALAEQRIDLDVAAGGTLEWLPQESILFPGARIDLGTRVRLAGDARFIGWEIACFGRPVIAERFDHGSAVQRLAIERDGRPLLLERLAVSAGCGLAGPSGLRGFPVTGTLIATGAGAADLAAARALLSDLAPNLASDLLIGCTLLDDLLVARALAQRVEPLLRALRTLWQVVRPRLLGCAPSAPRIWAT